MVAAPTDQDRPLVSVIVPARNEEAALASCLDSLISQTGVDFEIIVVDDYSTDRTREIAESFAANERTDMEPRTHSSGVAREAHNANLVRVIEADPLPAAWTGKNNAVATGAREACGEWLLFTDADTVHLPGSLARALDEACNHHADMLSYSPEQIAVTFWEMAILPVVFAELARRYPPRAVSDPASPIAAANGQYILIKREAYDAVGGHAAIADQILEDVALARAVKRSGRKLRFRYAADAVRTRMYRNFAQLREGWTKNLALLFPQPTRLAVMTLLLWTFPWVLLVLSAATRHWWWSVLGALAFSRNTYGLRRANFDLTAEFLGALFGMPIFAWLLVRSSRAYRRGNVSWKGRTYFSAGKQDAFPQEVDKQMGSLATEP